VVGLVPEERCPVPEATEVPEPAEGPVDAVIAEYHTAVSAGEDSYPGPWLQWHPALVAELTQYFDKLFGSGQWPPPGRDAALRDQATTVGEGSDFSLPPPPGFAHRPGEVFAGKYTLRSPIGAGGQGEVWEAEEKDPYRLVALKILRGGIFASPDEIRRFRREADVLAKLEQSHIVRLLAFASYCGQWYFSMDLMRKGSLKARQSSYQQDPRGAALLVVKVAKAVQYAHDRGILHRDLKPANILIDEADEPRLTDFGLAKRFGPDAEQTRTGPLVGVGVLLPGEPPERTRPGEFVGTAVYAAPEQAAGDQHSITTLTDVYGLGAVLYALLAGRAPFPELASVRETLELVSTQPPEPPSQRNRSVPRELEAICLKCLRKVPEQRYASAQELADELNKWLDGRPIDETRSYQGWERAVLWARRRPGLAAALASLVLVSMLGIGGIVWQWRRAEQHVASLRWNLYRNRVAGAYREYEAGHTGGALALLDRCEADLRGWEWSYLSGRRYREPLLLRHGPAAFGLAFDPQRGWLASAGADHSIKVWDATGRERFRLQGHGAEVRGVAFSPGGLLASASWDRNVQTWDLSTGKPVRTFRGHKDNSICVAFSPDSTQLASGDGNGEVLIWEVETGRTLDCIPAHTKGVSVFGMAYSPDGRWLVSSCDDGSVKVWDAATHHLVRQLRAENLDPVRGVAFSADGRKLCAACGDGTVLLWDLPAWRLSRTLKGHRNTVRAVAFNHDGTRLASGSEDRTVTVWDVATGDEILTLHGHGDVVRDVAFSADGRFLASADEDGLVIVRDTAPLPASGEATRVIAGQDAISWSVAFDPQGSRVAAGGADRLIRIWDSLTGRKLRELSGPKHHVSGVPFGVAFSADGRILASASDDGMVRLWHADSGALLDESPMVPQGTPVGGAWAVALTPADDKGIARLASAWGDGTVKVWKVSPNGKVSWDSPLLSVQHKERVLSVAFSTDGRFLAWAGLEKLLRLYDLERGAEKEGAFPPEHTKKIYSVAFSSDGTLATASRDGTVRVWDPNTGRRLDPVLTHPDMLECVAFSPNGRYLAAAGGDGAIRVWETSSYVDVITLYGHIGRVVCLAFSGDGSQLISSGLDKTLRVWDTSRWPTSPVQPAGPDHTDRELPKPVY
jgi:WD40 repeat protein